MNVFELANALRSMPDQQLVQLAQMHQNDAAVMAAVMNEKANRDKLRASASAAPAPQGQQPTVREQMLAGLGNIPTEGMTSMADGGIVSFAGGGVSSTPTLEEIRQYQAEQRALEQAKRRERSGSDTTNWLRPIEAVFDAFSGTAQAATPSQPVAPATSSSKHTPLAPEDIALLGRLYGTQSTGPEFIKKIVNAFANRAAGKKLTAEDNAFIEVFNTAKAYEIAAAKQAKAEAEAAVIKGSTPVTNASLTPTRTPGSSTARGLAGTAAGAVNAKASSPSDASAQSAADPEEALWQLLKQAVTEDARVFGTTNIKVTPAMLEVARKRGHLTKGMTALYEKQKAMERPVQEAGYEESGEPIMNAAVESASTASVAPARPAGTAPSAPTGGTSASAPTGGASDAAPASEGTGAVVKRTGTKRAKDDRREETAPPPPAAQDKTLQERIDALRAVVEGRQKTEQEGLATYQQQMRERWLPKEDGSELHKRREEALTKEEEADRRAGNLAWADALISMGAAMMSSKSPTFFGGLGEGVKAGAEEYAKVRDRLAARETRRQDLMMRIDEARTQVKHANAQEKRAFERQAAQEQFNLTRDQARDLAKITGMPEELAIEKIRDDQKRDAEWKYEKLKLEEETRRAESVARIRAADSSPQYSQTQEAAQRRWLTEQYRTLNAQLLAATRAVPPNQEEIARIKQEMKTIADTLNPSPAGSNVRQGPANAPGSWSSDGRIVRVRPTSP